MIRGRLSAVKIVPLLMLLGLMTAYPLGFIVYGGFRSGGPFSAGGLTLQAYREVFSDPALIGVLWTTFWLAGVRTAISVALATLFCWILVRTDTPFSRGLEFLFWLPFILPHYPITMGWILLLDSSYGLINQALLQLPFVHAAPFDIYSYGGIIFVHLGFSTSLWVLMLAPTFRAMDRTLEESAEVSGASTLGILRRITIPLMTPAILAATFLGFIRALEAFEVELLLGMPVRIFVFGTKVYSLISAEPSDYPGAMALSNIFMLMIFILIFVNWRMTTRGHFTTVTGRGYRPIVIALGRWRYFALGLCLAFLATFVLAPVTMLIIGTFMKMRGVFYLPSPYTLLHWKAVLGSSVFWTSLKNTLMLGAAVALLGVVFYSMISFVIIRTRLWGRRIVDFMSWLPWAVPGILLAVGFLWVFTLGLPFSHLIYGTLFALVVALVIKEMPVGVRLMNATMMQVSNDLEEAAKVSGAALPQVWRRILVPLFSPAMRATAIIVAIAAMRDLSIVILLASGKSSVLSTLMVNLTDSGSHERSMIVGVVITLLVIGIALVSRFLGVEWVGRR